jgi:hypothetical protein
MNEIFLSKERKIKLYYKKNKIFLFQTKQNETLLKKINEIFLFQRKENETLL